MELAEITELEKRGDKRSIEIFKEKGSWQYFDINKERTNDMTKAKYQKWHNEFN